MTDIEKNLMFQRNKNLIYFVLKRHNLLILEDDLYDIGAIGLVKGINNFDNTKGFKESPYLYACIFNEIRRYVDSTNAQKRKLENRTLNLEMAISDDMQLKDIIYDKSVDIEEAVIRNETINMVRNAVNSLKPRYREIINKYFFEDKTLEEIAGEFNVTREAIRQSRDRAICSLKKILKDKIF